MEAGQLHQRLRLQRRVAAGSETLDAHGQPTFVWTKVADLWGQVIPLAGREAERGDQLQTEISHHVKIRHRAGVTPRMRLLWGTRILEIESATDPEERKRELLLKCVETVDT